MSDPILERLVSADWRFHHLGVAAPRLAEEVASWGAIGYVNEGGVFEDPLQGVRGVFLTGPGPRLEILEPLYGSAVLDGWIGRGVRIYHQAFEVSHIDMALKSALSVGAKTQRPPVPAVAFGGRLIAFVMQRNMNLIEFIEAPQLEPDP
jgi:methylmalonyl-CoA/ethylmalonyl-CoA epimerase